MSQEPEQSNSVEKSPNSFAEHKEAKPERNSPPLSKRETEHAEFAEKMEVINGTISNIEQSYIFGVDIETKRVETEQKIQKLVQGMGKLSEESKSQIIENDVGILEREKHESQEKLRALTEQRTELIRQRLLENWGISFQSQAQESAAILSQQFELAQNLGLKEWQVDLRGDRPLGLIREALLKFKQESPTTNISFHGETPQIDDKSLDIRNVERLREEINLAIETGSDIYTVHPPSISRETFYQLPPEQQEAFLRKYAAFFAESIKQALDSGKQIVVAIENMPAGKTQFGQDVEEIWRLINKLDEVLEKQYNIQPQDVERLVGLTIDVNHAIHGVVDPAERERILRRWFESFGKRIEAFHIYCHTSPESFQQKFSQFLRLYEEYEIDAPIYLESKKPIEKTKEIFLAGRENPEIQMIKQAAEGKIEETPAF